MDIPYKKHTTNCAFAALVCALPFLLAACPTPQDTQSEPRAIPTGEAQTEADPRYQGPYDVGNVTRKFHNPAHWNFGSFTLPSDLNVEIWYPAEHDPAAAPQRLSDFLNKWDWITLIFRLIAPEDFENFNQVLASQRNAAPDLAGAPYPVVFFSHGAGGIRFQNWTMAEFLASHGFVVVAPDHTGDALLSTLDNRIVIFNPIMVENGSIDRAGDVSYLLDEMEQLTQTDPENLLTGLVDPTRAAVIGQSLGGDTVGQALEQDSRFLAGFCISSPQMGDTPPTDFQVPIFYLYGVEDSNLSKPPYLIGECYERSNPPKYRIDCFDAGHYSFTDCCRLVPSIVGDGDGCGQGQRLETGEPFEFIAYEDAQAILDSYLTAFMGAYLYGYPSHAEYLLENHFPDEMSYLYELPSE